MAMQANEIEALIKAAFPDAVITIEDLRGDGDHYACRVISSAFAGKNRVQRFLPAKADDITRQA